MQDGFTERREDIASAAVAYERATNALKRLTDHESTCAKRWSWLIGIMISGQGSIIGMLIYLMITKH